MSREAIEHVTAAEHTVAQIRQEANEKYVKLKLKEISKLKRLMKILMLKFNRLN